MYKIKRTFLNFIVDQEVEKERLENVFQPGYIKMLINDRFIEEVKVTPPNKWEGLAKLSGYFVTEESVVFKISNTPATNSKRNIFRTKEQAEASIALAQLSQLMYVYNEGWTPDWDDVTQIKYAIYFSRNKITTETFHTLSTFLVLKTEELRNEFLKNFEQLILQAKPLL